MKLFTVNIKPSWYLALFSAALRWRSGGDFELCVLQLSSPGLVGGPPVGSQFPVFSSPHQDFELCVLVFSSPRQDFELY